MRIRSGFLEANLWLLPSQVCRLQLLEEAFEWIAIVSIWQEPFPEGLNEQRPIAPKLACSSARRVRVEQGTVTYVSGCGVDDTLQINRSSLEFGDRVRIATFTAPAAVDPIEPSPAVWELVGLQLDKSAALKFVLNQP
jgi:hypothetical protein